MSRTLTEIARQLKDANKKVQLIYAFNGTGKTRLSREFKHLIAPKAEGDEAHSSDLAAKKILYYSAFTEDLFYWDNDLGLDAEPKLKIQPNSFTKWVLEEQGQDQSITATFQRYTTEKLTPHFSPDFSTVSFSFERGNNQQEPNIKISKGEESNFIWSVFNALLEQLISELNIAEVASRSTDAFNNLEYVFIDDPVSSLDENHLIELAVNVAGLIKSSQSDLKFIVTTHSPLFYNVLFNELKNKVCYLLGRFDDGSFALTEKNGDSNKSFSYHLHLKQTIEQAIADDKVERFHFTLLRNLYEKTASFLGHPGWSELLPTDRQLYLNRIIQFTSHSTLSNEAVLLKVLLRYSVFDTSNTLLVMRPYQIAATERILWKINSAYQAKSWSTLEGGGFIWHTTGSGKTLTSFKAARLATELEYIDKVFFVVDRKDLDYQTMKEYQRFSPDSVNGSDSTAGLKRNLEKDDNRIIVTTIQKLNNLMKSEGDLPIYSKQVVFIFDECHRSQFGEAQKNLKKKFKKFYQFGFTGTPIFPQNALGAETTASVFGRELHSYVITDAIRDEKVLKFKVDYNDVRPQFKAIETEKDEKRLSAAENKQALLHPDRIREITQYILNNFRQKTHRLQAGGYQAGKGFNAMFAVSSVDAAKLYYEAFKALQKDSDKPLKVATIFSFAANEEQDAVGEIQDESFDVSAMNSSAKEALSAAIADYNALFKTNFSVDSSGFQNYYRDLAKQVKAKEIDLLIVVGMFLTGFDAPTLNTLFADKNLRYHGLIQAYSRTNRIFDATKTFGNIITFRDLQQATIDAITLFGDKNTKNVVLEKSYKEYMVGFTDAATGEARRGFVDLVTELEQRFPDPAVIEKEADKKAFVKLFGEYLRVENVLQNYDEFASLKALQGLDMNDPASVDAFKAKHHLDDGALAALQEIKIPSERKIQDYRSTYNDVRDWLRRDKSSGEKEKSTIDWDDVVFEVDLLKSQEINLDYILELIFDSNRKIKDKAALVEDVRRVIRASLGNRAKESLLVDFINQTDLDQMVDKASVIDAFFTFAQAELQREAQELINAENMNTEAAKRYITTSLKREFASDNGTELNAVLPKMSPLNPQYLTKKQSVFHKLAAFVEKYKGVGGRV